MARNEVVQWASLWGNELVDKLDGGLVVLSVAQKALNEAEKKDYGWDHFGVVSSVDKTVEKTAVLLEVLMVVWMAS